MKNDPRVSIPVKDDINIDGSLGIDDLQRLLELLRQEENFCHHSDQNIRPFICIREIQHLYYIEDFEKELYDDVEIVKQILISSPKLAVKIRAQNRNNEKFPHTLLFKIMRLLA